MSSLDFFLRNARYGVLLLLVLVVLGVLYFLNGVLLPFALALFLAYLLNPAVAMLNRVRVRRVRIHRGAAILGLYAVLAGMLALSGTYLVPRFTVEVNRMVRELPVILRGMEQDYVQPVEEWLNAWIADFAPVDTVEVNALLDSVQPEGPGASANGHDPAEPDFALRPLVEQYTFVVRKLDEESFEVIPRRRAKADLGEPGQGFQFNRQLDSAFEQVRENFEHNFIELVLKSRGFVQDVAQSVFTGFLVFMVAAFLMLEPQRISGFMRSMIPQEHQANYAVWLQRLDHGLSGVVRGQVLICIVNGILTGVGLALIGVPFVVTLSVLAGVFSLIPIFGVLLSTVPILVMALTVSAPTAALALGWILVIHFIEGNFLNPKILGDSARIHPALIVFALVVGEHLGGVLGALLAVPVFSLLLNSFLFLKTLADEAPANT